MFIIVTYDVKTERCNKVLKILRKYLFHVQKSVFDGEITHLEFVKMKEEVNKVIIEDEDSIIYYQIVSKKALKKEGLNFLDTNVIII